MAVEPNKIIALDPGKTTGVAIYSYSKVQHQISRFWKRTQVTELDDLWKLLCMENPDVVVYEAFVRTLGGGAFDGSALEAIGVIKLYAKSTGKYLHEQSRQIKKFWDDDKVKALDLWEAGQPHATDATRHMLYFLMQERGEKYYINKLAHAREGT